MKPRLYLDIDGVLNSKKGDVIASKKYPKENNLLDRNLLKHKDFLHLFWDKEAVDSLRLILETVKPEIYIHSTWKNHFKIPDFISFFKKWNLDSSLIKGIVPNYKMSSERYHNLSWHIDGDRIGSDEATPCKNYVVIDDIDMRHIFEDRDVFKTRQIVTDPDIGLTLDQAETAIKILSKN